MGSKATKSSPIPLTGDLDIFSIQAQWAGLKGQLPAGGTVVLDLSGVGDLDLSGCQLLASAQRRVQDGGGKLTLQGLSEEAARRLRDLGFKDLVGEAAP